MPSIILDPDREEDMGRPDPNLIFLELRADLVRQARRTVTSAADADDVVQEAWLRWQRHHATVESPTRWLRIVTRNLAVDSVRRNAAHRERDLDRHLDIVALNEAGFEGAENASEVMRGFRVLLGSLSGLERVVFVLRESLDWPHADIAQLLGRTEPAVRQLQHRAARHTTTAPERFEVKAGTLLRVSEAFASLRFGGDLAAFLDVLAPGVARLAPGKRVVCGRIVHEVAGLVLLGEGRQILLCHRRSHLSWYPGVWDVVGSHVRSGETPAACAVRAAKDKLKVSVLNAAPLTRFEGQTFQLSLLSATQWDGSPNIDGSFQHDAVRFFTRQEAARVTLADPRYLIIFDHVA